MKSITQIIKRKKILFISVAVVIVASTLLLFFLPIGAQEETNTYVTAAVERNTITTSISGSGSLETSSSYEVTSEVSAEIKSIKVQEGDKVEEGDILAVLDGSSVKLALEKAKLNYNNALEEKEDIQSELDNLKINSTVTGIITQLNVSTYKNVQKGDIVAEVTDDSIMSAKVYFDDLTELNKFSEGQSVTGTTLSGKSFSAAIEEKNTSYENVDGNNYYYLMLYISNTNSEFKDGSNETITISNGTDSYTSLHASPISYIYSGTSIIAEVSGEVSHVYYSQGDKVSKNNTIAKIDGDDLEKSLENQNITVKEALIAYNNAKEAVNNLNIVAEQDGTVSSVSVQSGDMASGVLMKISDYDNLNVVMSVDELDLNEIEVGQKANIASSLYEDKTFKGTITKIALEGNAQNGVTTFDVTIAMDEIQDLKSGMSVDIEIILQESANVLTLPLSAVQKDDNGYFVYKTDNTNVTDELLQQSKTYIEVGLTNNAYAEITSGLSEGDIVIYQSETSSSSQKFTQNIMQNSGGTMPDSNSQNRPSMPSGGQTRD